MFTLSFFFAIAVASPPDRRVTRDDIGVASAGAAANNATATGCSGASGAASTRPRNPSSSPDRNGQLSSKFSRYYLPEIRFNAYRPNISASVFLRRAKFFFPLFFSLFLLLFRQLQVLRNIRVIRVFYCEWKKLRECNGLRKISKILLWKLCNFRI